MTNYSKYLGAYKRKMRVPKRDVYEATKKKWYRHKSMEGMSKLWDKIKVVNFIIKIYLTDK